MTLFPATCRSPTSSSLAILRSFIFWCGEHPGCSHGWRLACHHSVCASQQCLHSFKNLPLCHLIVQICPISQIGTYVNYDITRTFDYFIVKTRLISAFPNGPAYNSATASIKNISPGSHFEIQLLYCLMFLGMSLAPRHSPTTPQIVLAMGHWKKRWATDSSFW